MMTDWDESVRRVSFRRKRTADAGDTPTLSKSERRDLTASRATGVGSETSSASSPSAGSADGASDGSTTTGPDPFASDPDAEPAEEAGDVLMEAYPATFEEAAGEAETDLAVEDGAEDQPSSEPGPVQETEPVADEESSEQVGMQEPTGREPAVATLWEFGQFVTYVMVKLVNSLVYGSRVVVAKASGNPEPVDRLAPLSHQSRHPDPSRWSV